MKESDNDVFFRNANILCGNIINQRQLFLKTNKAEIVNEVNIREITRKLAIKFKKSKATYSSLAFFINFYYLDLFTIIPCTPAIHKTRGKLYKLMNESQIINSINDNSLSTLQNIEL